MVGHTMFASSVLSAPSSVDRIAFTCETNAFAGLNNCSGPIHPSAGNTRRNERGPIIQRAASLPTAAIPSVSAVVAHDCSSSSRQAWLRHAVATSVSERTLLGCFNAMI